MMSANRSVFLTMGLAAVIAAAAFIAWQNARLARDAKMTRATLTQKSAMIEAEGRRIADRVAAAREERKALQSAFDELKKSKPRESAITPVKSVPKRPWIPERLQKEPEFQVLWLADQRASLTTRYGPFFQKLGLSPAQVESFQSNRIKREEQQMDLQGAARTQGLPDNDATIARLGKKVVADYEAAQRTLLGEEGYRNLQDYERGAVLREIVAGLAGGAVVVAREPLSPQQAEQFFQAIANASPAYRDGGASRGTDIDWMAVDAEAEKFLSPTQFAFFKTHEPPLPLGGRFQSELYRLVDLAKKTEPAHAPSQTAERPTN